MFNAAFGGHVYQRICRLMPAAAAAVGAASTDVVVTWPRNDRPRCQIERYLHSRRPEFWQSWL